MITFSRVPRNYHSHQSLPHHHITTISHFSRAREIDRDRLARIERYRGRPNAAQKCLLYVHDTKNDRSSLAPNVFFKSAYAYMLMGDAAASERQIRQLLSVPEEKGQAN
ncbi:uncharacterized protein MYCFIDRAFT_184120 [Pseudocercospora fijiensis CIRAD86]|uniref:Uncharacterized protein n=1 Tax=Pseudocercospora fijiensis (strain CIRAD86) TaxID=383855 RepID=M2ZFR2_PSEFD|nr:uncharacterized protein MYCFIDRAFT_184120 [Pseudocercospora fijiensis CIRAD86]EME77984.1 hypothetical protein MYCFIDRAFT_184120 [Pseudocercospora fijiensis CIRAD86]